MNLGEPQLASDVGLRMDYMLLKLLKPKIILFAREPVGCTLFNSSKSELFAKELLMLDLFKEGMKLGILNSYGLLPVVESI